MAVKLPDTLVPMADFPSAFAKDVQFTDGENLQDKLDKGKLGSSSSGTGLTEEQANNIEKIPSIEGIVTSNSQAIENKADKDHEHTEYLKEIPDEYVTDTELSTELDKKVNKEVGKGLSTNDLTNELITKINSSATEAFVTNAIANAQLGDKEVDLSGYATVDALNLKADLTHTHDQYLTKVPDEYITETELTAKGYLTEHQDISNLALKSEIPDVSSFITSDDLPTVPTKVSELTNDSNFITSIPEEYITETELANELSTRNVKTYTNITQLGLTAPVITGKIYNALPENSIFQCEIVDNKTVSDTPETTGILIIQKSSKRLAIEFKACARFSIYPNNLYLGQLKGDDGSGITWNKVALSSDLEGYVTDTELSSKGYATETFVTSKIAEASSSGGDVGLSGYATPPGVIFPFAGSVIPVGYLLCDGREVSRADYSYLFDTIGTTYGDGDGITTFNLPDLQDRFVQGAGANTVGTKKSAGLPNITGSFSITGNENSGAWGNGTGAFDTVSSDSNKFFKSEVSTGTSIKNYIFNASKTNSIYGKSTTVQPPAVVMNYIIKY